MRKILLASTALFALSSVSAMATDITLSGSYAFKFQNDTKDEDTDAGAFSSEGDVNIKFSNTTDSGLTTTLNYGMHETGLKANAGAAHVAGADGAAYDDDLNASLTGDFGTIYFTQPVTTLPLAVLMSTQIKPVKVLTQVWLLVTEAESWAQAEQALATSFLL